MTERIVLRGLKRVDGTYMDLVVEDGIIAGMTEAGASRGGDILDYTNTETYVSSGWIDLHVHAFEEFDPYGDAIDKIGVEQGVATVVDAGSTGADRIGDLRAQAERAATNVLALLNISRIGLMRTDELSDLAWVDPAAVREAVAEHQDFIVGLKARISRSVVRGSGIEPLKQARALSDDTGLPVMVHIGSAPPGIEEIIPYLQRDDVITHYLNGKANNLFRDNGEPLRVLTDAIARGVHLDVGHGTASFSFKAAESAKRHHIPLHTISSDIYRGNRLNGPVYSLARVMSKFLYLGYSLAEVVASVTTHAADWLKKPELGRIQAGDRANLTLFEVRKEPIELTDSEGDVRIGDQHLVAKGVFANGKYVACEVRPEARH
ncbi:amidohydrolase/deacetylase family metallohydrolase [Paenibacillus dendritiformis]|uniref:amidohydrolase/deacetylase family metallohydrolase n=1 Tax=Paenibacillus dendritiformis TaxID=130049 RepID=UPI00143D5EA8|nr:amidohydrolase/deacetylase family metallohydrolase [Paenibacillus dendritiformis]NKI24407.1 amidohydrolase/deacetylase family metallohydrolase [Paenibacillus dendritiformis]NRG00603.1 amidohydrolase/deacetylase family metallohydrolase [Paenibacillus dendritiformis]